MERRLVKQGNNALTVTLPAKWLRQKGLKPGDTVNVAELGKDLLIGSSAAASTHVEIDVRGAERSMIYHVANGKYIEGYDLITLVHDAPKVIPDVVAEMYGMILQEQTAHKAVLKSIVKVPEDNFEAVLRRAAHIFIQQADALAFLAEGKGTWDDVKRQEKLLDQNIMYCLRYLNKYEGHRQAHRDFLICATLELAVDQLTRIAKHIGKNRQLADVIAKATHEYVRLFFEKDFKRLYTGLRGFRNQVGTKTFVDGLAYTLAEILYNYIGYVVES